MSKKVLIVDDNPSNSLIAQFILEDFGIDSVVCHDAKKALELIEKNSFNLILSDWMMPDMDGLQLLHKLIVDNMLNDTPFVISSAKNAPSDKHIAINSGARDYLAKPITRDNMKDLLTKLSLI